MSIYMSSVLLRTQIHMCKYMKIERVYMKLVDKYTHAYTHKYSVQNFTDNAVVVLDQF